MKLLLTSNGISNSQITEALFELTKHPASKLKLAFIPTAANIEDEDKGWLVDNLVQFKELSFAKLDIIDIAAVDKDIWVNRIDQSDILVFGGGDTTYLVDLMQQIGFDKQLRAWLETKLLVGISAGSVMCGPIINPKGHDGLGYVDFLIVPHKDAPFANRTTDQVKGYASKMNKATYWLDDQSAITVNGNSIKVVGSGKHAIFDL